MSRSTLLKIVLPFLVLLVGVAVLAVLIVSRRPPAREVQEFAGALVETVSVERRAHVVTVSATGIVQARQQAELVVQVSGQVTWLADQFVAGGLFEQGASLFRLEDVDYRLAVERAGAELAAAELALATVRSQARVAREEWQRLQAGAGEEPNPLVLYEPQLKNAEARVAAARAALRQAEIDLQRTEVRAPFNALVRSETIDLGQYLRSGSSVGTLLGTDKVEIVVPLPLEALGWVKVPRQGGRGSAVKVRLAVGESSYSWSGRVVRTLGEVDPLGRMVRVVVAVDDPYLLRGNVADGRPPLAIGSFVEVALQGRRLPEVGIIPRRALRDGDTVWLADDDSRLRIRPVQVLRREQETIIVGDGLQGGERVIVSALSGAADGLKVRVREEEAGP